MHQGTLQQHNRRHGPHDIHHGIAHTAAVADVAPAQKTKLQNRQQEHDAVERPPLVLLRGVIVKQAAVEKICRHCQQIHDIQAQKYFGSHPDAVAVIHMLQCQKKHEQGK